MNEPPGPTDRGPSDSWDFLRRATPARIALGRVGDGLPTQRVLEFQLAHAKARDAVHAELDADALAQALADFGPRRVASEAATRAEYLQRPDLGRRLSMPAGLGPVACDAVLVIADGLSATAVQTQAAELSNLLLTGGRIVWAPPVIARQARVALGDAVAAAVGARLVVVLIGERPGLSASDSLGAYLTYAPRPGLTRDAERNCISNIRPGGLSLPEAARRIRALAALALAREQTGVALKEDEALALAGPDVLGIEPRR